MHSCHVQYTDPATSTGRFLKVESNLYRATYLQIHTSLWFQEAFDVGYVLVVDLFASDNPLRAKIGDSFERQSYICLSPEQSAVLRYYGTYLV